MINIKLNGLMVVNNDEYFFNDLEVEIDEYDDFDCDIERYVEDCDVCGFCEEGHGNDFYGENIDEDETLEELIEDYAEVIYELFDDEIDINDLLVEFLGEAIDNILKSNE